MRIFARIMLAALIFSLAALWISFTAPAFYRRWVGEAQPSE